MPAGWRTQKTPGSGDNLIDDVSSAQTLKMTGTDDLPADNAHVFAGIMEHETGNNVTAQTGQYMQQNAEQSQSATGANADSDATMNNSDGAPEKVELPTNRAQLCHIFAKRKGHVPDSLESRELFLDVSNNKKNYYGKDKRGNHWHAKIMEDGSQVWVRSRNGIMNNAGVNLPSDTATWDPKTGFYRNLNPEE